VRRNHPRPASLEPTVCQLFKGREAQSGWREQGPTGCRAQKSAIHPPSLAPSSSTSFFAGRVSSAAAARAADSCRSTTARRYASSSSSARTRSISCAQTTGDPPAVRPGGRARRPEERQGTADAPVPPSGGHGAAQHRRGRGVAPPPRSRTNWTRLVPLPVLTGHVSSL